MLRMSLCARLLAGLCLACTALAAPSLAAAPLFQEVHDSGLPTTGKGFGATWADLDHDGRLDLLLNHHGAGVSLYYARDNLRFEPAPTAATPNTHDIDLHGGAACDYNGDGRWDVYFTAGAERGAGRGFNQMWQPDSSAAGYRNGLPENHPMADLRGRGRGALFARLDANPQPALIVLNYQSPTRFFRFTQGMWRDHSELLNPYLASDFARRDYPESRGLWLSTGAAGDLDGDGRTDLVLAGDGHFLLRNDGRGGLEDQAARAGLPEVVSIIVDIDLGDVDNDGDLDILYTFRWRAGVQIWLNDSTPGEMRFRKGPSLRHLPLGAELDAACFADFDNDGLLDLYISAQNQANGNEPNVAARGLGGGEFKDMSDAWGGQAQVDALPCGAWPIDLDQDGDLDLLALHGKADHPDRAGLTVLYENTTPHAGLTVELVAADGTPHALGARVALQTAAGRQTREVRSVQHYWNSSVLPLHFGVGGDPGPYLLSVAWPDGSRQTLELPRAGLAYRVRQGQAEADLRRGRSEGP